MTFESVSGLIKLARVSTRYHRQSMFVLVEVYLYTKMGGTT